MAEVKNEVENNEIENFGGNETAKVKEPAKVSMALVGAGIGAAATLVAAGANIAYASYQHKKDIEMAVAPDSTIESR